MRSRNKKIEICKKIENICTMPDATVHAKKDMLNIAFSKERNRLKYCSYVKRQLFLRIFVNLYLDMYAIAKNIDKTKDLVNNVAYFKTLQNPLFVVCKKYCTSIAVKIEEYSAKLYEIFFTLKNNPSGYKDATNDIKEAVDKYQKDENVLFAKFIESFANVVRGKKSQIDCQKQNTKLDSKHMIAMKKMNTQCAKKFMMQNLIDGIHPYLHEQMKDNASYVMIDFCSFYSVVNLQSVTARIIALYDRLDELKDARKKKYRDATMKRKMLEGIKEKYRKKAKIEEHEDELCLQQENCYDEMPVVTSHQKMRDEIMHTELNTIYNIDFVSEICTLIEYELDKAQTAYSNLQLFVKKSIRGLKAVKTNLTQLQRLTKVNAFLCSSIQAQIKKEKQNVDYTTKKFLIAKIEKYITSFVCELEQVKKEFNLIVPDPHYFELIMDATDFTVLINLLNTLQQ